MQIFKTALIAILAASTVQASPFYPFHYEKAANATKRLNTRKLVEVDGKKIKVFGGKCVAYGMVEAFDDKYSCWNSHCTKEQVKSKAKVRFAADEDGKYVAKCPDNDLTFDWQWPDGLPAPWEEKKKD